MADNPAPGSAPYDPYELVFETPDRLPVYREDYDIDNDVFAQFAVIDVISARTGKPVPEYLSVSYYDPQSASGSANISNAGGHKGIRVCSRLYPDNAIRDMNKLYTEAKNDFDLWWLHIEPADDASVSKEAVKEIYLKEFMFQYQLCLDRLDRELPENLRSYHGAKDKGKEYVKQVGWTIGGEYKDYYSGSEYKTYMKSSARWRQDIAVEGRGEGFTVAEEDAEIGIGFKGKAALEKLAAERFGHFWSNLTLEFYFEEQSIFDYLGLRNIYVRNFIDTYTDKTGSGETPEAQGAGARIVATKVDQDALVYVIEIIDPEHLTEPLEVEVAVSGEDDIKMRDDTDHDG